ncbi:hypothetical protein AX279_19545 [Pseudomonas sp. J237]|nr:hypothetical protein AX279_19545 [Pseudomonas sp. J237]
MDKSLDDRVLEHLHAVSGSTAWAMRAYVNEIDRKEISKALQRLKRKGLVRTSTIQAAYWRAVPQPSKGDI